MFDLKASIEYDEDYMEGALAIVGALEQHLNQVLAMVKADDYSAGDNNALPYMDLVFKGDEQLIPFKHLLSVINNTHTEGYAEAN